MYFTTILDGAPRLQSGLVVTRESPVGVLPARPNRLAWRSAWERMRDEFAALFAAAKFGLGEHAVPRAYVECTRDRAIAPVLQRMMVVSQGVV